MEAAAVEPILLLRVNDKPLLCQQQGAKDPRQVIAALGTAFPGIRWVIQVMVTHQDSI
jgi:hypothetical protein